MSRRGTVLALDLALQTGWAFGAPGDVPQLGSVRLPAASCSGCIMATLCDWLADQITVFDPWRVVLEAPLPVHKSAQAARILLGLVATVELVCYRREVPVAEQAVSSVRAAMIGSGRAKKEDVMAWCARQGWRAPDHNAADAAALWAFACRRQLPERIAA